MTNTLREAELQRDAREAAAFRISQALAAGCTVLVDGHEVARGFGPAALIYSTGTLGVRVKARKAGATRELYFKTTAPIIDTIPAH